MMLSKRQFAAAVGSTEKWVDNASRLLSRRFRRTDTEARWLGLVRTISHAFDISLERSGELATSASQLDPRSPAATIGVSRDGALRVVIDLERYHTRFAVALAAALLDQRFRKGPCPQQSSLLPRTRSTFLLRAAARGANVGRLRSLANAPPAKRIALLGEGVLAMLSDLASARVPHILIGEVAAVARGAPRDRPPLEVCWAPDTAVPGRLSALLVDWDARPLNVSDNIPFILDAQIVTNSPVLALATRFGEVILRQAADYPTLADSADLLDLGPVRTLVLRVESLIAALKTTRRRVPVAAIPELEAAAALSNGVDLRP